MLQPADDYQRLGAFYEAVAQRLEDGAAPLFEIVPEVSGWSVAGQLYHILRANGGTLKAVEKICRASPPLPDDGQTSREATVVLTRGRFPRGKLQAPPSVTPPEDLSLETLTKSLGLSRRMLERVEPFVPTLLSVQGRIPHHVVGPLNAAQWLCFTRIHAEHHLGIIREIEAAQAAPSA